MQIIRNTLGAFSDAAVLLPLLFLLAASSGFSSPVMLLSTGLVYIVSAALFRVPMSVQPLKSIAVASITIGATNVEVRLSGLVLGILLLSLCIFNVNKLGKLVPLAVIHQLQIGLGVLLILQGIKAGGGIVSLCAAALLILLPEISSVPLLGLVASFGLFFSFIFNLDSININQTYVQQDQVRVPLVAGLVLPQIVLTIANSVLATKNVCDHYFGTAASRVKVRTLMLSIGFGNILTSLIGGLPFCHGSGGVTAHVKGGSTHAWSTILMGTFLIIFGLFQFFYSGLKFNYSPILMTTLLVTIGVFHIKLARTTAQSRLGILKLASAIVIVLLTKNLIWVLASAVIFELLEAKPWFRMVKQSTS